MCEKAIWLDIAPLYWIEKNPQPAIPEVKICVPYVDQPQSAFLVVKMCVPNIYGAHTASKCKWKHEYWTSTILTQLFQMLKLVSQTSTAIKQPFQMSKRVYQMSIFFTQPFFCQNACFKRLPSSNPFRRCQSACTESLPSSTILEVNMHVKNIYNSHKANPVVKKLASKPVTILTQHFQ